MDNMQAMREKYKNNLNNTPSSILKFHGINNRDVYNCSVPFYYKNERYILGRVEKTNEWASSNTYLFKERNDGEWYKVSKFEILPIEDPFYIEINGEIIVGGTHVVKELGNVKTYYVYFYRGKDIFNLKYFTTGPEYMKDIRLVQLPNNKIGVFSRPRNDDIKNKFGCESQIGFTIINDLNGLTVEAIESAKYISGFFSQGEWGGINQALYLGNGKIGLIGHHCYSVIDNGTNYPVYMNTAYVFDYTEHKIIMKKIIGQRNDYPYFKSKVKGLGDCAFTSGIFINSDGTVDLYSGLSDTAEGVKKIGYPFNY